MKKTKSFNRFGMVALLALAAIMAAFIVSCSDNDTQERTPAPTPSEEISAERFPSITDTAKLAMLRSMKDLSGDGRLYEINYTVDYKLNEVVNSGYTSQNQLFGYIMRLLYDKPASNPAKLKYGAGCSAFAVPEAQSIDFLMGRNYDFKHAAKDGKGYIETSAILVHTAPANGKKSISLVDGMNLDLPRGFYGESGPDDLSLMMGLPYACLDGINEDGFSIGILALSEAQTDQRTGKKRIAPTVMMRMLLDRVSTVKQAIDSLKVYDMSMVGSGNSNYHFFMADATGDYAIVEYTRDPKNPAETNPTRLEIFTNNDTLRCVTNFYVSPTMVGTKDGWGSDHGKARYWTMRNTIRAKRYTLKENDAMALLKAVSQPPSWEITSQTQWSALYNLTERTMRLAILRDYAKEYKFKVGQVGPITK